jgi:hypothetical protein
MKLAYSKDGNYFVCKGKGGTDLRVVHAQSGDTIASIDDYYLDIKYAIFSHDGTIIYFVEEKSNTIHVWNFLESKEFDDILTEFDTDIISISLNPVNNLIVQVSGTECDICDPDTEEYYSVVAVEHLFDATFSLDGNTIILSTGDTYDTHSRLPSTRFYQFCTLTRLLHITCDNILISCNYQGSCTTWDTARRKCIRHYSIDEINFEPNSLSASYDGKLFLCGGRYHGDDCYKGIILVWDIGTSGSGSDRDDTCPCRIETFPKELESAIFSPCGGILYTLKEGAPKLMQWSSTNERRFLDGIFMECGVSSLILDYVGSLYGASIVTTTYTSNPKMSNVRKTPP